MLCYILLQFDLDKLIVKTIQLERQLIRDILGCSPFVMAETLHVHWALTIYIGLETQQYVKPKFQLFRMKDRQPRYGRLQSPH